MLISQRFTMGISAAGRYRLAILSRTLLAVGGGYLFAALSTASLALVLPLSRAQAVMAATQLSFAFFCAFVVWSFCAPSLRSAWLVAAGLCVVPCIYLLCQGVLL